MRDVEEPSAQAAALTVAPALTREEREAVYRLRYRIFVEEMGYQAADADHARKMLTDALDDVAAIYYLTDGTDVVAAMRTVQALDAPRSTYGTFFTLDRFPEVPPEEIQFTAALMIAPEWRGTRALEQLFGVAYDDMRRNGIWLDFTHCAPSLVGLYEAMGYRRFRQEVLETDAGLQIPLALVGDDVEHLTRVRSPFAELARRYANDPAHGQWFASRFAEYAQPSCARLMGSDEFWSYLTSRIHVEGHPLLAGLSDDDARRILDEGTVLRIPQGQRIVRTGDVGDDMFMILSGVAEVRAGGPDGAGHVLETLGTGQVFGEMSFLSGRRRTADVVALSDVRVLSLNRQFLERLTHTVPTAASRMLLNLSVYLIDRLQHTTRTLTDVMGREADPPPPVTRGATAGSSDSSS